MVYLITNYEILELGPEDGPASHRLLGLSSGAVIFLQDGTPGGLAYAAQQYAADAEDFGDRVAASLWGAASNELTGLQRG